MKPWARLEKRQTVFPIPGTIIKAFLPRTHVSKDPSPDKIVLPVVSRIVIAIVGAWNRGGAKDLREDQAAHRGKGRNDLLWRIEPEKATIVISLSHRKERDRIDEDEYMRQIRLVMI